MSPRVYTRRFDHEEALRRLRAGERPIDLAAEYGVSPHMICEHHLSPEGKARQLAYSKEWRTGECEYCGEPCMRLVSGKKEHNVDGLQLCLSCRGWTKRERFLFDDEGELVAVRCSYIDCANGERWQPPENFHGGPRYRDIREKGIHSQCRACNTRSRKDYRERQKVPCEQCGEPCLPASEKGKLARTDRTWCGSCARTAPRGLERSAAE